MGIALPTRINMATFCHPLGKWCLRFEPRHEIFNNVVRAPAKPQISLHIRAV